jgi:SAM-dependent methyltransferase
VRVDFDKYATSYESEIERVAGVSVEALAAEKAGMILEIISYTLGDPKRQRVLDLGCGIGLIDQALENQFADLTGVDISEKSLELARIRTPGGTFVGYNGRTLPFPNERFDAVFIVGVLLLVAVSARTALIAEVARALRPGGVVIVMEHNPYNPVTRFIVSRCALDADSKLLTRAETSALLKSCGFDAISGRYFGFFPWRGRVILRAERCFSMIPLGVQYIAFGIKSGAPKNARPGDAGISA